MNDTGQWVIIIDLDRYSVRMACPGGIPRRLNFFDAADLLYKRSLKETIDCAMAGKSLSQEMRIRNRRDQGYVIRTARDAAEILLGAQGGKGLFETNPVQRAMRDLQAVSGHMVGGWDMPALNYGSVTLGGPPTDFFW